MVWIHGGGFTFGSAIESTYHGTPLVALGDVVVITVNYRLGALGFLTTGSTAVVLITIVPVLVIEL